MIICLNQVPGVEADDVIGTLASRSVSDGYKVISVICFHCGIDFIDLALGCMLKCYMSYKVWTNS